MTDSLKKRKFKLGTTSFIIPDDILPNVEFLGPYFDEIELLVFESLPESVIPSRRTVSRLKDLAREHSLSYNIHLPTDINPAAAVKKERQQACDTILKILELFEPVPVTTHTLHLPMPEQVRDCRDASDSIDRWQKNAWSGMALLAAGLPDPGIISIETLDYPFEHVEPVVNALNLSVCIDAGHQIKYGHDLMRTFSAHKFRTPLIHLHGVDMSGPVKKDHVSLNRLPDDDLDLVRTLLYSYDGVVSLEVFQFENLIRSLDVLSGWFDDIPVLSRPL